jgi:anti-sigma factor RsiW
MCEAPRTVVAAGGNVDERGFQVTCVPAKTLLESHPDDELDGAQTAHVAEHLASCTSCAAAHAQLPELRAGLLAWAPYYRAPAVQHDRIQVSVRQADRQPTRRAAPVWRWMGVAAAVPLAVSPAWNVALFRARTSSADLVAQDSPRLVELKAMFRF